MLRPDQIIGGGNLYIFGLAHDHPHRDAQTLHQGGVVGPGKIVPAGLPVSGDNSLPAEGLGCLHDPDPLPGEGAGNPARGVAILDGIPGRDARGHGAVLCRAFHGPGDQVRRDKRSGGIMNDDQLAIIGQGRDAVMD